MIPRTIFLQALFFLGLLSFFLFSNSVASATPSTSTTGTPHPCLPSSGKYTTHTQEEYGAPGTVANAELVARFSTCFPSGLTIGASAGVDLSLSVNTNLLGGGLSHPLDVVFDSAAAVTAFLPQLESPGHLIGQILTDPVTCSAGKLAGDVLALRLNAVFDEIYGADKLSNVNLTSLVLVKGPCAGLSVDAVLDVSSLVLSNIVPSALSPVALFAPANIDACVAAINSNFLDGTYVGTFLALPGFCAKASALIKLPLIVNNVAISAVVSSTTNVINPRSLIKISLSGIVDASVTVSNGIYNAWFVDLNTLLQVGVSLPINRLSVPSTLVSVDVSVNLNLYALVNYVLNFHASAFAAIDVQLAILQLLHPSISLDSIVTATGLTGCHPSIVSAIVADARLHGVGFVPAPGQIAAVVIKSKIGKAASVRAIIEVKVPALDLATVSTSLCVAL